MSNRVRQASTNAHRVVDTEEATSHIAAETVSRLKAACIEEPSALRGIVTTESGETFGMVCELAAGTTATVYLAVDRRTEGNEKFLAVKRFLPELTREQDFASQFVADMRLASTIDHPFVCKVKDFGRAGDSYYAAMEFVIGQSLDEVLFSPGFRQIAARAPRLIARLIANLADGLHALHMGAAEDGSSDGIHGDITPRNLFVLFDGSVRVSDFGMAWLRDALRHNAADGASLDHSYLAPEQLEGGDLDARVDVWALGVVLWELLAGQKLFRCPTAREAKVQITARRIPPPSEFNPKVDAELDRIVLKALTRNRNKRYAAILDFSNELEKYLDETGSAVKQPEVAAWLTMLFPTGSDRDRGLIEMANIAAARLPNFDDRDFAAPDNGAYSPAAEDDSEHTTHIFAGRIENTMRSAQTAGAPGVETVSLRDAPITVRRLRRSRRKSRWQAALVPFAVTFSVGLVGLGAAQTLLPNQHASKAHANSPVAVAKLARPVQASLAASVPAAATAAPAATTATTAAPIATAAPALPPEPATSKPHEPVASATSPVKTAALAVAPPDVAKPAASVARPASSARASGGSLQTGQVFLTTPGGGDVYDRGRFLGRAPGGFELSTGWHTLVIKAGSDNRTATVQVRANSSVMVSVPATVAP